VYAAVAARIARRRVSAPRAAGPAGRLRFELLGIGGLARQWLYGAFAVLFMMPAVFGPQQAGPVRKLLRSCPLTAIGVVSSGVYLWHETWIQEVRRWLHMPLFRCSFVLLTLLVVGLSVVTAAVSYVAVEGPCQRFGHRRPAGLVGLVGLSDERHPADVRGVQAETGGRRSAHGWACSS
jgi:peptidoglycan/LPS O-acetylase OafA/YrhL